MHKKILIVEDSQLGSFLLRLFLCEKFSGIECIPAFTYAQAKAVLDQCKPDLIFLDTHLPAGKTDPAERFDQHKPELPLGIQLLLHIRRSDPDVPIIGCSGEIFGSYDGIFNRMNVTVMRKPYGYEDVASTVERVVTFSS